jgi:transposase-like protein
MERLQRRRYDEEFKRNAVALSDEPGRKVVAVARNLGVTVKLLYRWRMESQARGVTAFPGHGRLGLTVEEQRVRDLEKQLADVTLERDILKKAVAIFSKTPQ